jgi:inorganic pyrophosphatase
MNEPFWKAIDELVARSELIIDRPRGRPHPRRPELIYPFDYGYQASTTAGDGEGIDVWVGSGAGLGVTGVACTADLVKRDAEIKILLHCTPEDAQRIAHWLNHTAGLACHVILRPGCEG